MRMLQPKIMPYIVDSMKYKLHVFKNKKKTLTFKGTVTLTYGVSSPKGEPRGEIDLYYSKYKLSGKFEGTLIERDEFL